MWKHELKKLNTQNNRIIIGLILAGLVAMVAGFMADSVLDTSVVVTQK